MLLNSIINNVYSILLLNSLHYNGVIFVHPLMGYHGHYSQQPSRSEVLPGVPHCRDNGYPITAPVEDSCYQQGPQCGQPHPQSYSMEQHPSWAPHNQCPPQQRGHYQFQSQSHQDVRFTDANWRNTSSSPGGISDVPSEAPPLDPNLTCPHCRKQFRKGDIQNFRLHANTCH